MLYFAHFFNENVDGIEIHDHWYKAIFHFMQSSVSCTYLSYHQAVFAAGTKIFNKINKLLSFSTSCNHIHHPSLPLLAPIKTNMFNHEKELDF